MNGEEVRTITAPDYRWTTEDQAHHVADAKRYLLNLLRSSSFEKVEAYSNSLPERRGTPVTMLCVYVAALREELIAWCKA
jgi:hypothetical protein